MKSSGMAGLGRLVLLAALLLLLSCRPAGARRRRPAGACGLTCYRWKKGRNISDHMSLVCCVTSCLNMGDINFILYLTAAVSGALHMILLHLLMKPFSEVWILMTCVLV